MRKFFSRLADVNWWSVTAVWFVVLMFALLVAPAWADAWALACGITAIVASVFSLAAGTLPRNRQ